MGLIDKLRHRKSQSKTRTQLIFEDMNDRSRHGLGSFAYPTRYNDGSLILLPDIPDESGLSSKQILSGRIGAIAALERDGVLFLGHEQAQEIIFRDPKTKRFEYIDEVQAVPGVPLYYFRTSEQVRLRPGEMALSAGFTGCQAIAFELSNDGNKEVVLLHNFAGHEHKPSEIASSLSFESSITKVIARAKGKSRLGVTYVNLRNIDAATIDLSRGLSFRMWAHVSPAGETAYSFRADLTGRELTCHQLQLAHIGVQPDKLFFEAEIK